MRPLSTALVGLMLLSACSNHDRPPVMSIGGTVLDEAIREYVKRTPHTKLEGPFEGETGALLTKHLPNYRVYRVTFTDPDGYPYSVSLEEAVVARRDGTVERLDDLRLKDSNSPKGWPLYKNLAIVINEGRQGPVDAAAALGLARLTFAMAVNMQFNRVPDARTCTVSTDPDGIAVEVRAQMGAPPETMTMRIRFATKRGEVTELSFPGGLLEPYHK